MDISKEAWLETRHFVIEDEFDTIEHHGIKGQKWGVRRYQNSDGSYTDEGRKRHSLDAGKSTGISKENFDKINQLYNSMPLKDRKMIDPDCSENPRGYFPNKKHYYKTTAFNAVSKDGFILAEKIPKNKNVPGTTGVEIGIGVKTKNKGVGTKLTEDLVNWFNSQDDIDTLWWPVDEKNTASIHIAEKNGFIKDPLGNNYVLAKESALEALGIDKTDDYISHHGIKGQHWGITNGPPYPLGRSGETLSNGNAIKLKRYDGPAYFISEKKLDTTELKPRVPKNYLTKNGYEDGETPRVSFAPSIDQCLAGLSQNLDDKTFYVYEPVDISKCEVYKPNKKAVPDSEITNELWITNPVEIKQVKKIKVTGNRGEDGKIYSYGDKQAMLFDDWTYEEV